MQDRYVQTTPDLPIAFATSSRPLTTTTFHCASCVTALDPHRRARRPTRRQVTQPLTPSARTRQTRTALSSPRTTRSTPMPHSWPRAAPADLDGAASAMPGSLIAAITVGRAVNVCSRVRRGSALVERSVYVPRQALIRTPWGAPMPTVSLTLSGPSLPMARQLCRISQP